MSGTIKKISVNRITNYFGNPRHAEGKNEIDTLKKLFNSVGVQYMLNLAEDIQKNGLLGNQQIVVIPSKTEKNYTVYEGNRRIAAIKLLLNPTNFIFLDKASMDKAICLSQKGNIPKAINCYVTDEKEAFFIMQRTHSGEDRGRGVKQWNSREKEAFKVRQNKNKTKGISYLIDLKIREFYNGFDITSILPFTTIQRIFNNPRVKNKIGLNILDESTFTPERMNTVIETSKWILEESKKSGVAATRLFNKSQTIDDLVVPWLEDFIKNKNDILGVDTKKTGDNIINADVNSTSSIDNLSTNNRENESNIDALNPSDNNGVDNISNKTDSDNQAPNNEDGSENKRILGGTKNLPYFFQGLDYRNLNPNDSDSHGVSAICRELQLFSDRKLVTTFPISSAFLVRSIIEHSIKYYSKKHTIQAQNKLIWEEIKSINKLSDIIKKYERNLPNYITDTTMRQYFNSLFSNYQTNVDPLNWVVHRPSEFRLDSSTLISLPQKGLLALVNFFLQ